MKSNFSNLKTQNCFDTGKKIKKCTQLIDQINPYMKNSDL